MAARLGILILLLTSCTVTGPSSVVEAEWQLAVNRLTCIGVPGASRIRPEQFNWRKVDGAFECNGVMANGCYGNGVITWNTRTPKVIRHEAGHAILDRLKNPWWRCYEHGDTSGCPVNFANPALVGC